MAKIQIKPETITPFGGIFPIMETFNRPLGKTIDPSLCFRSKFTGYQFSEIIRSLMRVYSCGSSCIENISKHLMPCLSQHPRLCTCSTVTSEPSVSASEFRDSIKALTAQTGNRVRVSEA